ncbi:MAG TPA: serine hydrolase [Bacilli bacterium]|nr:serine hydrolase [Bacilli bacterium]
MLQHLQASLTSRLQEAAVADFSVAIRHLNSGEEYLYNADEPLYAASIIKLPIMSAVFEQAHLGHLRLTDKIAMHDEDKVTGSGLLQHLSHGLELTIHDLLTLMIIDSDNTATNLLVDRVGIEAIQRLLLDLDLKQTQFHHKLQILPAKPNPNRNRITAREMMHLMSQIATGQVVSQKACREMIRILYDAAR